MGIGIGLVVAAAAAAAAAAEDAAIFHASRERVKMFVGCILHWLNRTIGTENARHLAQVQALWLHGTPMRRELIFLDAKLRFYRQKSYFKAKEKPLFFCCELQCDRVRVARKYCSEEPVTGSILAYAN